MVDTELVNQLREIKRIVQAENTKFNDLGIAGKDILAATNATLPPNQRFAMILDNDHLTLDEMAAEATAESPFYKFTTGASEEHILRTRERNTFFAGSESVGSVGFQFFDDIPDGQFTPDGVTIELGYGGLESGTLSGVPYTGANDPSNYDKDGVFLRWNESTAELVTYKGGTITRRTPHEDFDVDPHTDFRFDWSLETFTEFVFRFDPAGSADVWYKLRDDRGDEFFEHVASIGNPTEPLLEIWDMPVSIRVEGDTDLASGVEWGCSGFTYFNRTSGEPPFRNKSEVFRDPSVDNSTISSAQGTVIATYRQHPDRVEAVSRITGLEAISANADFKAETREIHRDHLTFPAGVNPDNEANWIAPSDQRVRDTSLERLNVDSGEVTIDTHTDLDGQTKMRGKQDAFLYAEAGQGQADASSQAAIDVTTISELNYIVVIGRIAGNADPNYVLVRSEQRW